MAALRVRTVYRSFENKEDGDCWIEADHSLSRADEIFTSGQLSTLLKIVQRSGREVVEIVLKLHEILEHGDPSNATLEVFLDFEGGHQLSAPQERIYDEKWSWPPWPNDESHRGRKMESIRVHKEIEFRALQRQPTATERQNWLRNALRPLGPEKTDSLFLPLDDLFSSVLTVDELLHDDVDNPVEHHTAVLSHMIEIALGEHFDWPTIRIAAALSILHDNWPAKKVTRAMRREAKTPQEAAQLEERSLAYRTEHMSRGSENAKRRFD